MALRNRDRRPEEEPPEPVDTRMLERLAQLDRWVGAPAGEDSAEDTQAESTTGSEVLGNADEVELAADPELATESAHGGGIEISGEAGITGEAAPVVEAAPSEIVETVPRTRRSSTRHKPSGPTVIRRADEEIERSTRTVVNAVPVESRPVTRSPVHAIAGSTTRDAAHPNLRALKPARAITRAGTVVNQSIHSPRLAGTPAEREASRRLT